MKITLIYTLLLFSLGLASCIDKPIYPSEPVIAYQDFIRYGSNPLSPDSVELVVSFTDNEGDIGLEQSDTSGIFKFGNLYMNYLFWDTTGVDHWSYYDNSPADSIPFDTLKVAYRVPPVLPEGDPAEPMKGLIYVKMITKSGGVSLIVHNRIKYNVYIYDKALHKSNVTETTPLDFQP